MAGYNWSSQFDAILNVGDTEHVTLKIRSPFLPVNLCLFISNKRTLGKDRRNLWEVSRSNEQICLGGTPV